MHRRILRGYLRSFAHAWIWAAALCLNAQQPSSNQTLRLKDPGDFVHLPSHIIGSHEQVTVESWVKWDQFQYYSQPFGFAEGDRNNVFALNNHSANSHLQFFVYHENEIHVLRLDGFLETNRWYHFAVSAGPTGTRLVCNGIVVQQSDFSDGLTTLKNDTANYLGKSQWDGNAYFKGELDEVRVWDRILTVEEIRANLFRTLHGTEPGLIAYWNFDDGTAADLTPSARNGTLMGKASCPANAIPRSIRELRQPSILSGIITDSFDNPLAGTSVQAFCGNQIIRSTFTNAMGEYRLEIISPCDSFDLWCEWKTLGAWTTNLQPPPGLTPNISSTLTNDVQLEGFITALDHSPQEGASVQALIKYSSSPSFEIVQTTQSDNNGRFAFSNLRPGDYVIRTPTGANFVYYRSPTEDSVPVQTLNGDQAQASVLHIRSEATIDNVAIRFFPQQAGRWRKFSFLDGLGNHSIHSLYEASDGMIWIGTADGIISFDGKSFQSYDDPNAPNKITIRSIIETPQGTLWFATPQGVYQFNEGQFRKFTTDHGLLSTDVFSLAKSKSGPLWCATSLGLSSFWNDSFHPSNNISSPGSFPILGIQYLPNGNPMLRTQFRAGVQHNGNVNWYGDQDSLLRFGILASLIDSSHHVWFSTMAGVSLYRLEDNLLHWTANPSVRDGFPSNQVTALKEDTDGTLWFGTEKGEIYRYDKSRMTTISTHKQLTSDPIGVIMVQRNGNLWIGTHGGGILLLERSTPTKFDQSRGLPAQKVSAVAGDSSGTLWFGFDGGGVSRYDGEEFKNYSLLDSHGLPHNTVTCLEIDHQNRIWAGTDDGFVALVSDDETATVIGLDPNKVGKINALHAIDTTHLWIGGDMGLQKIKLTSTTPKTAEARSIHAMIVESHLPSTVILDIETAEPTGLWIATQNEGVILLTDKGMQQFGTNNGLPKAAVNDVYITANQELWSVTSLGIYRLQGEMFRTPEGAPAFLNTPCYSMTETSDGKFWIATDSAGVRVYDGINWTTLDIRDGLAGDSVFQIFPHQDGSIWLATDGGISRYRPDPTKPKLAITDLIFDAPIEQQQGIFAARTGSRVRFEYRSIDFKTAPTKRQYQVRVVPLAKGKTNSLPFQSINDAEFYDWASTEPGAYRFEARAIDRDLNYSPIASREFVVAKPWYLRMAFVVPSAAAGATTLFAVVFLGLRLLAARREARELSIKLLDQEREKNSALSDANERIETQKEHLRQASQAKSVFLAHMSHEIRTPLHTVMGYASLLKKNNEIPDSQRASAEIIERSGKHLLTLVNEVLDLSKIEAGKAKVQEHEFYLWDCIQSLDAMFRLQGEQKGLQWHLDWNGTDSLTETVSRQHLKVRTDEQKLKQILFNLLNNAIKFTESGEIRLAIKLSEPQNAVREPSAPPADMLCCEFMVSDTGVGIAPDERETVMEPFNRGESSKLASGTGLGLSIAARFVEMLGGKLKLHSEPGIGSQFSFQLNLCTPSRTQHLSANPKQVSLNQLIRLEGIRAVVAEDNDVNRELLINILEGLSIDVTGAGDGIEAVQMAKNQKPDVVFLDIQMPKLDGIAACEQIRSQNNSGSQENKPVLVAVSAAAFEQDKNKCFEAGFNEFVPKPFDEDEVKSTLARLLLHACIYDSKPSDPASENWTAIPEDRIRELRQAAEIGSVSDIERIIQEIEMNLDPLPKELSEVQNCCRRFDFSGIQELLNRLSPSVTPDEPTRK